MEKPSTAFLVAIMAAVTAHYICKWLDDDDEK